MGQDDAGIGMGQPDRVIEKNSPVVVMIRGTIIGG